MFIPDNIAAADLINRVRKLEAALSLSFGLMKTIVQRLEDKMGPGFVGPELNQLIKGAPELRQQVMELDALVAKGETGVAARLCRELAGITWDEAHNLIGRWGNYPFEKKLHWIETARWLKALTDSVTESVPWEPSPLT